MNDDEVGEIMQRDAERAHALEEQTVAELLRTTGENTSETSSENAQPMSVHELMEKYGVTAEDFQAVCEENPQLITCVGGGKTCEELAKSADRVQTKYQNGQPITGKCLPGVRSIYSQCKNDSLSCKAAQEAIVRSRLPYQSTNGGGNGFVALEASGNYITLAIENKAYGTPKNSAENAEMNRFVKGVQPGITLTVDSIEDPAMRQKCGNNNGGKYGHIAVKRHDNCWGCDFKQDTINFSRYGRYARVCVPTDAIVSGKYTQKLIERAQNRQQANSQNLQMAAIRNRSYE